MTRLTKQESDWLRRLQNVLDDCPSERLGFYTIGDAELSIYNRTHEKKIHAVMDRRGCDFGNAVDEANADFYTNLRFPALVHSVAG